MAIIYERLLAWPFADVQQSYRWQDCSLYALGVGFGADPLDQNDLRFVYEAAIRAVPTMATIIAAPNAWVDDPKTGIDTVHTLHGEQEVVFHKPLAAAATLVGSTRVTEIVDRGTGRGAILTTCTDLREAGGHVVMASVLTTLFLRNNGGFGGTTGSRLPRSAAPDREPDLVIDAPVASQAALLYRLNGDYNPLHIDPEIAKRAGFERPILHGLCLFGIACRALIIALCDYDETAIKSMKLRFVSPVYPGETVRTRIWSDCGRIAQFDCVALERGIVVATGGEVSLK